MLTGRKRIAGAAAYGYRAMAAVRNRHLGAYPRGTRTNAQVRRRFRIAVASWLGGLAVGRLRPPYGKYLKPFGHSPME